MVEINALHVYLQPQKQRPADKRGNGNTSLVRYLGRAGAHMHVHFDTPVAGGVAFIGLFQWDSLVLEVRCEGLSYCGELDWLASTHRGVRRRGHVDGEGRLNARNDVKKEEERNIRAMGACKKEWKSRSGERAHGFVWRDVEKGWEVEDDAKMWQRGGTLEEVIKAGDEDLMVRLRRR